MLLLENVFALLSRQKNCRILWKYLLDAGGSWSQCLKIRMSHIITSDQTNLPEECRKRGLVVHWVSLTLANCGLAARVSEQLRRQPLDRFHISEARLDANVCSSWRYGNRRPYCLSVSSLLSHILLFDLLSHFLLFDLLASCLLIPQ